jgi:hypothetical protein
MERRYLRVSWRSGRKQSLQASALTINNHDHVRRVKPKCAGVRAMYAREDANRRRGLLPGRARHGDIDAVRGGWHRRGPALLERLWRRGPRPRARSRDQAQAQRRAVAIVHHIRRRVPPLSFAWGFGAVPVHRVWWEVRLSERDVDAERRAIRMSATSVRDTYGVRRAGPL